MCHSDPVLESGRFSVLSEARPKCYLVTVSGEVDAHSAGDLRTAVEAGMGPEVRVVADLSAVTFLDSTGLGVFVTALKRVQEQGGSLDLVVNSPRVLRVFELTGLDSMLTIHPDLATALA